MGQSAKQSFVPTAAEVVSALVRICGYCDKLLGVLPL